MSFFNSPPILSELDLAGSFGQMILVELELLSDLLPALTNKDVIVYSSDASLQIGVCYVSAEAHQNKISRIVRSIQQVCKDIEDGMNINFLIHGIDMMDLDLDNRRRGSLRKGMLSMLPPRILKGANVIITSTQEEYMLRELCDRFINLRTTNKRN